MPDAPHAKIVLRDVHMVFRAPYGGGTVRALDTVSLAIGDGEFACLLGPSGCGKSTLLNLVAGFERPAAGDIRCGGQPVTGPSPGRAVVFQEAALFPWLSVEENILFGPRELGLPLDRARERAGRLMALTGLTGFERHFPAQLSGGMKQRVALARVLVMEPEVLLMDEPFGALDAQTRSLMQELLLTVWEEFRQTVLFITHDVDEAILLADVVHVMTARPGRIKRSVPVPLSRPRSVETVTSARFSETKREVLGLIREEAIRAASLEAHR